MKTVKELRIGNWLLNKNNKQIVKVRQIRSGELLEVYHTDKLTGYTSLECLDPIPLTKEMLLKCGIKGRVDFKWKGNVGVQIINEKYYISLKDRGNVVFYTLIEVEFLHQLQNLIYALTNTELKIEL